MVKSNLSNYEAAFAFLSQPSFDGGIEAYYDFLRLFSALLRNEDGLPREEQLTQLTYFLNDQQREGLKKLTTAATRLSDDSIISEISEKDYRTQKMRRFGRTNPEVMDVPFWVFMIQRGWSAFDARWQFDKAYRRGLEAESESSATPGTLAQAFTNPAGETASAEVDEVPTPEQLQNKVDNLAAETAETAATETEGEETDCLPFDPPVWCFERFGMSHSRLPDGRVIFIGGEHEDFYDPDFCIYNDVIVMDANLGITIYGYPEEVFPPTDFHTATLVGNSHQLYIIGSLGYTRERHFDTTQVYLLNTETMQIEAISTGGDNPGWISRHRAKYIKARNAIKISGGKVFTTGSNRRQEYRDNPNCYWLDLKTRKWSREKPAIATKEKEGRQKKAIAKSTAAPAAQPPPVIKALEALAQAPQSGVVRIFKVGSIHDKADTITTPVISRQIYQVARKLGVTLKVRTVSAYEFNKTYPALVGTAEAPEIIVCRTHLQNTLETANGGTGVDGKQLWQQLQSVEGLLYKLDGFATIDPDSTNYGLAVKLVLEVPPLLSEKGKRLIETSITTQNEAESLKALILKTSQAYLGREMDTLHNVADPQYFEMSVPYLRTPAPSVSLEPQLVRLFDMGELVFALVSSKFVSPQLLGQLEVATIWRRSQTESGSGTRVSSDNNNNNKQRDKEEPEANKEELSASAGYKLLVASHDPLTVGEFLEQVQDFSLRGERKNARGRSEQTNQKAFSTRSADVRGDELEPAQLLLPLEGEYALPAKGERFGEMVWQPSPSQGVVAEIVEIAYETGNRLLWIPGSGKGKRTQQQRISTGILWGGGRGVMRHWRVWSIRSNGEVIFSEPSTFRH